MDLSKNIYNIIYCKKVVVKVVVKVIVIGEQ